ncbi:unnamed protein product [Caenorhabditis sp. 36 PRJEB53466]|nr:unnamed protein product [Caenorhabditis sp. 36 PRJEB53466]
MRVLIVDFNAANGVISCWNTESFTLMRIRIEPLTFQPENLSFLVFEEPSIPSTDDGIVALKGAQVRMEDPSETTDYIKVDCGVRKISAWIGFSPNPAHQTFKRTVAFADLYGLVDCAGFQFTDPFDIYGSFIVVNDLDFIKNGTKLFKIDTKRHAIKGKRMFEEAEAFRHKLRNYEEGLMGNCTTTSEEPNNNGRAVQANESVMEPAPVRPTRSIDHTQRPKTPLRPSFVPLDNLNPNPNRIATPSAPISNVFPRESPAPRVLPTASGDVTPLEWGHIPTVKDLYPVSPIANGVGQMGLARQSDIEHQRPTSLQGPFPPAAFQQNHPVVGQDAYLKCKHAVVIKKEERQMIVWLNDCKQVAGVWITPVYHQLGVGVSFECFYKSIPEKDLLVWEVMEVSGILEHPPFPVREISQFEFEADLQMDLSRLDTNFRDWTFCTDVPVFKSLNVGSVIVEEFVTEPRGNYCKWREMMKMYYGRVQPKNMLGTCRLVEHDVPLRMVDANFNGEDPEAVATRYVWKLHNVLGSVERRQEAEKWLKERNFGNGRRQWEENDDIARQKRVQKSQQLLAQHAQNPGHFHSYRL